MPSVAVPTFLWPSVRGRGERILRVALGVVGLWTAYGLLRCGLWWAIDPARYSPLVEPRLLACSMLRAGFWAVLSGAVWWLCRLVPWRAGRAPLLFVIHAAGATGAAALESAWYRAVIVALRPQTTLRPFASRFLIDLTGNAFLYLAVVAVAYARQHRALLDECRLHALRQKTRSTTARLHVLGRQLQPHFLCNALNAIAELFHRDLERARHALGQLRALLLGPLSSPDAEVRLSVELAQLEPYLAIQRLRFGERLDVAVRVAPEALPLWVPSLLLQPLVENAMRHGVGRRAGAGRVEIDAALRDGRLEIVVRDDGAGLGDGPPREGVGLRNTRLRLAELHGPAARVALGPAAGGGVETRVVLPARGEARPAAPPDAADPALPALPAPARPGRIVGAILLGWLAVALCWSGVGVLRDRYLPIRIGFWAGLWESLVAAAVFAAATLGLLWALRARPLDRWSRAALHVGLLAAAVALLPIARCLVLLGWTLPPIGESAAANLQLDLSVCIVAIAGAHAALYLGRARDRILEAARHEDELATAALEVRRMKLDPPALAAALDRILEASERDPERADELAAQLGDELRAALLREAGA